MKSVNTIKVNNRKLRSKAFNFALFRAFAAFSFVLSFHWLYWVYGRPIFHSLNIDVNYSLVGAILLLAIVLSIMGINLVEKKLKFKIKNIVKLAVWGAMVILMNVQLFALFFGQVYINHWNWGFDALQELNYLFPFWSPVILMLSFFCFCLEIVDIVKGKRRELLKVAMITCISYMLLPAIQWITISQPLWVIQTVLLFMVTAGLLSTLIQELMGIPAWKSAGFESKINYKASIPKLIFTLIGIFVICFFFDVNQGQFIVFNGYFRVWAIPAMVSGLVVVMLILVWQRWCNRPSSGLLLAIGVSATSYLVLGITWNNFLLSWDLALTFVPIGPLSFLAWLIYYSREIFQKHQHGGILMALSIWMLGIYIIWRDPLFEFWEIEGDLGPLIDSTLFPDSQGLYSGAFYVIMPIIPLAMFIATLIPSLLTRNRKRPVFIEMRKHQFGKQPIKRIQAVLIGLTCLISVIVPVTALLIKSDDLSPQILSRMDNQGILWLANPYDRVSRYYSFSTLNAPVNPEIQVCGLKGEHELVQVVFSNYANKLQTFRGYNYGPNPEIRSNKLWISDDGAETQYINITMGRVGYVDLYEGQVADLLLPWEMFTTYEYRNYPMWLRISIPENATPGVFTTYCYIEFRSWISKTYTTHRLEFQIKLKIWNATLPKNRKIDTTIDIGYNGMPLTRDIIDMHIEYRADVSYIPMPVVNVDFNNLSAGISINWTEFDAEMTRRFEMGASIVKLNYFPVVDCKGDPESILNGSRDKYLTAIKWFYGNATLHLLNKTTPWNETWAENIYCRHSDEHSPDPKIMAAFNMLYGTIKNATNGTIKTACTLIRPLSEYSQQLDTLDIWIAHYGLWTPESQEFIESNNKTYWTYSTQDGFPSQDTEYRDSPIMSRVRGWSFFAHDIRGFLHWSFSWNHADSKTGGYGYSGLGEGYMFYVHDGTYVPTLRVELYRDGMEDAELLWLLEEKITEAEAVLGATDSLVLKAKEIINEARNTQTATPRDLPWDLEPGLRKFTHDPHVYADIRARAGDALDSLIDVVG
ncbi:MAG: DUF4091 domain-containing protein [Promethearchaeota archaeon]